MGGGEFVHEQLANGSVVRLTGARKCVCVGVFVCECECEAGRGEVCGCKIVTCKCKPLDTRYMYVWHGCGSKGGNSSRVKYTLKYACIDLKNIK